MHANQASLNPEEKLHTRGEQYHYMSNKSDDNQEDTAIIKKSD